MRKLKTVLTFVGLFLGITTINLKSGAAQNLEEQPKPSAAKSTAETPVILVTTTYPEKESKRQLSLLKSRIPPLTLWDREAYYKKYPDRPSLSNTAFILLEHIRGEEPSEGRVLLLLYEYDMPPPILWSADIKWGQKEKAFFLVLAESQNQNTYLSLKVYKIDPSKEIAKYPINLDPKDHEQWPKASNPISEIERRIRDDHGYGVDKVTVQLGNGRLLIHARRKRESPSIDFSLDLNTKVWSVESPTGTKVVPFE